MTGRTLIKCGWLVTLDPAVPASRDMELLIAGNSIAAIGKTLSAEADETIDARGMIVMPGLVNAHMHTWQTALRGIASEWASAQYHRIFHGKLAPQFKPQDNYLATLIGALAQIDGGTTTLVDWCHNISTVEAADRSVDGLIDSGIRAVFCHGTAKPDTLPGNIPFSEVPHPRDRVEYFRKGRLASDEGRVTLAMAILGPDYSTWEVTQHDVRMAREFGLSFSWHTRRPEDMVTKDGLMRMMDDGLLGPDANAVHAFHYGDTFMRRLVETGTAITSCVMNGQHHQVADLALVKVRECGGLPSLGIDNETFVTGSMFAEMQAALRLVRHAESKANALRGNSELPAVAASGFEALQWTTLGGAKAFRLDKRIGSLAVGKRADIVMLRANDLNLFPVHDPVSSIVEQAHAGNVDTVIIDGVVRKRHGKLTFDAATLRQRMDELAASGERILRDGGQRAH